jgi:hypothetical protein
MTTVRTEAETLAPGPQRLGWSRRCCHRWSRRAGAQPPSRCRPEASGWGGAATWDWRPALRLRSRESRCSTDGGSGLSSIPQVASLVQGGPSRDRHRECPGRAACLQDSANTSKLLSRPCGTGKCTHAPSGSSASASDVPNAIRMASVSELPETHKAHEWPDRLSLTHDDWLTWVRSSCVPRASTRW